MERRAQGEPEIDGLLACVALLRQMREGTERLLEVPHGLAVGRPRHGLLPRLPAVRQGLVPHLAPQGMVGQAFDLLGQPVPSERFQGLDDAGMQRSPPLLQQAAIGHLVRQGVLEGVFRLGEEPRLVEELRGLEVGEAGGAAPSPAGRQWPVRRGNGTSVPMTAAVCSRRLSSGGSRSMRAASTACTVAGTWMLCSGCARR